jgi:hypothetical protein
VSSRLVTALELAQYPSGIDWNTIAEDAGAADPLQAIEQGYILDTISSWAGEYTGMPLGLHASSITEQAPVPRAGMFPARVIVDSDGWLNFWAKSLPVLSLTSAQWSYVLPNLAWMPAVPGNPLPNQGGASWVLYGDYPHQRQIVLFDQDYSSLKHQPSIFQCTYVSGWPNAIITGTTDIPAGPNVVVPVDTSLGMTATSGLVGNILWIADGGNSEYATVSAVPDGQHVTFAQTINDHKPGLGNTIAVSAIPPDIRSAICIAAAGLARVRGAMAFQMNGSQVGQVMKGGGQEEALSTAEYMLNPYRIEF